MENYEDGKDADFLGYIRHIELSEILLTKFFTKQNE
jgi:hypothetical protein